MAEYLNSNYVKVYPSGYRSSDIDFNATRTTEESVTRALKAPLGKSSFVKLEENNSLTIVINGYIFNVDDGITRITNLFSSLLPNPTKGTNIYAHIVTQDIDNSSIRLMMLVNSEDETQPNVLDKDNEFKGLAFTLEDTQHDDLIILEYDSTWTIPEESKLNLKVGTLNVSGTSSLTGIETNSSTSFNSLTLSSIGKVHKTSLVTNSPSVPSSGTNISLEFIDTISQYANGKINPTKKKIPEASTTQSGIVNTIAQTFSGKKSFNDGVSIAGTLSLNGDANFSTSIEPNTINFGTPQSKDSYENPNINGSCALAWKAYDLEGVSGTGLVCKEGYNYTTKRLYDIIFNCEITLPNLIDGTTWASNTISFSIPYRTMSNINYPESNGILNLFKVMYFNFVNTINHENSTLLYNQVLIQNAIWEEGNNFYPAIIELSFPSTLTLPNIDNITITIKCNTNSNRNEIVLGYIDSSSEDYVTATVRVDGVNKYSNKQLVKGTNYKWRQAFITKTLY